MKKTDIKNQILEGAVDWSGDIAVLAASGMLTPQSFVLGGMVNIGKRIISTLVTQKEIDRVEKVHEMAFALAQEKINSGSKVRKDIDERFIELTEGTLLKAKDSYEEKKLPLLANLLANSAFTNTPIENLNQTLIYAEQLSYRQLVEISVIGINHWDGSLNLSGSTLSQIKPLTVFDEKILGVYSEISHLMSLGIIGQFLTHDSGPAIPSGIGMISPAELHLLYPGDLLYQSMLLDEVDKQIFDQVVGVLKYPLPHIKAAK
jgi:hypothetical protein